MIERIFCGAVTRGSAQKEGRMSYTEFVWFLLSEEVETSYLPFFVSPFLNLFPGQATPNCDRILVPLHGPWWRWTSLHVRTKVQKSKSPISWNISSQVWTWILLWRATATDGAARNRNSSLRRLSLPGSALSLFLVLSISYNPLPSDAGHDQAAEQARHHLEGLEAVQDDPGLLWHLLQLGEIPRPRTERPVCHPEGDRRGWKRGKNPKILCLEKTLMIWQICYFSSPQMSDWDRFAAEEYELLVAEEGTAEPMDDMWVFEGSSIQTWISFRLSSNSKTHLTCWLCRCYDDGGDPGRGGGGDQSSLDSEMVTHDSWDRVTMVLELWDGHPSTCDNWIDSKNHSQEYVFKPEANPDSVLWHWMWCGAIWSSTEVWKWIETLEHKSSEGQLCSNCLTVKKPRLSLKSSQKCSKSNSCEA